MSETVINIICGIIGFLGGSVLFAALGISERNSLLEELAKEKRKNIQKDDGLNLEYDDEFVRKENK